MANPGEGLQIAVGANIKALERQMKAAARASGQAADDIDARFKKLNPTINSSGLANAAKGFAAAFTMDKIIRGLADANSELVRIGETAKRVGLDTAKFQELQFAGRTNGLTNKQFGTGIEGLAEKLNDSRQQETALSKLFDENNLKLKDRKGAVMDVNTALGQVANLTKNAATEFDKIKIAEAAGLTRDWVPMLEQGADAIARQATEAGKTGAVIDSEIIAKAKDFERDWSAAVERWSTMIRANAGSIIGLIDTMIAKAGALAGTIGSAVSNYAGKTAAVADLEQNGVEGASRSSLEWGVAKGRELGLGESDLAAAQKRLEQLRELDRETARAAGFPATQAALQVTVTGKPTGTSSLFDKGKKGGGSDEDRVTSVQRYVDALGKAQAVAEAERQTVGLSVIERAKAVALAQGQAAAQRDVTVGLRETAVLTSAEKDKILGIATATATWAQETKQVKESMEFAKDLTADVAKGFLDDLMNGAKAADALNNALKRIASTLANKAIEGLIGGMFGGSGTNGGAGGFMGLLGGLMKFDSGGWVGGSGTGKSDSNVVRVSRGEHITNARSAQKYGPLLEAINKDRMPKYANGGFVGAMSSPTVPAGISRGGGSSPKIVINNTQSQSVQTEAKQESNGDISVWVSAIEARIADNVLRNRGPLSAATTARQTNRQLRG
jgi:hypothetical protein